MLGRHETGSYQYIHTNDQFVIAIEEIQRWIQTGQTITVDCEGVNLSRFVNVTLISIGSRTHVFLIDVLNLGIKT